MTTPDIIRRVEKETSKGFDESLRKLEVKADIKGSFKSLNLKSLRSTNSRRPVATTTTILGFRPLSRMVTSELTLQQMPSSKLSSTRMCSATSTHSRRSRSTVRTARTSRRALSSVARSLSDFRAFGSEATQDQRIRTLNFVNVPRGTESYGSAETIDI